MLKSVAPVKNRYFADRLEMVNIFCNFAADLGHCPKGWEELPGSNKCYLITDVHDMRTRDDASAQCQLQQAQLVKIDSIQERVR